MTSSPEENLGELLKIILKWEGLPKLETMKKKTDKVDYIYRLIYSVNIFFENAQEIQQWLPLKSDTGSFRWEEIFLNFMTFYTALLFLAICIHYFNDKSTPLKNVPPSLFLFGNVSAISVFRCSSHIFSLVL